MKTISLKLEKLLNAYENFYQTQFCLSIDERTAFGNVQAGSAVSFLMNGKSVQLISAAELSERELQTVSIAIAHLLEETDENSLFAQGCMESLSLQEQHLLELRMKTSQLRIVYLEMTKKTEYLKSLLQGLLENWLFMETENGIVLLLPDSEKIQEELISIKDTLETELFCKVQLGLSSSFTGLKNLKEKVEEAKEVLQLLKQYEPSVALATVENTRLYKLAESLSLQSAQCCLKQLVNDNLKELDEELRNTAAVFLKHDLNLAVTARQLFIHRNTLIYRLDKLALITGLDLRHFDEAFRFQLAMILEKRIQKK